MSNKRKYREDDSPEREITRFEEDSIKKHSLDSDEEDYEQEKKAHYDILDTDDIEGQEDGISGVDGEIKITPFNMKEELEEGHFDTEGNFHWNKDNVIRDNWQENIDWMKVKEINSKYQEKDHLEDSMDSMSHSPFDHIAVYKQILDYMEPGETVLKTLKRLGGNKSLSASERLKRKKAGLSLEDKGDSTKVTELTELANRLLTKTGNMDVYQESYQYIKKLVDSRPGTSKYDSALDMYADDFDEKEKERMENKAAEAKTENESDSTELKDNVLMWEYKLEKDSDKVKGPHTTEQMQKYVDEGFFKGEIWSPETFVQSEGPLISVPFEYKTEDEKFLEEASKFTDLMKTSALDICQHKVILKIKTSCFSMTEEELAKMSVNLLNCQSEVDERKIFPCTESMTLKECTKDMDANMWNAYHLMNNRARAVCLAARRTQFQALSEMTVNKLMATAHDQIKKMTTLLEGQEKLESLTLGTLDSVEKGHVELMEQQENLKSAQKTVQEFVTFNLEQLTQEKALIAAGNKELAKMTKTIKEKLDEANEQLIFQSEERLQNHQKLLEDIEALQKQARDIFQRIDSSTEKLLAQHEVASLRYKDAVENLIKINDTVHYLLNIINTTRREIDERFYWLQDFLDGTGTSIERLSSITFHIAYLLIGMLFASFLNFSSASRAALAAIVPLNLFVTYHHGSEKGLDFSQMTVLLSFTVLVIAIIHKLQSYFSAKTFSKEYITSNSKTNPQLNETSDRREHSRNGSKRVFNGPIQYLNHVFNKFSYSLNQLLSFVFGWVGKKSSSSLPQGANRSDENFISSSFQEDRNGRANNWSDYSYPRGGRHEQSVHNRVNEWLQTKVDYAPRSGSPASTTSESSKFFCSAVCLSGRRCKNVASPGRDVCHRHLYGSSIAG